MPKAAKMPRKIFSITPVDERRLAELKKRLNCISDSETFRRALEIALKNTKGAA